MRMFLLYSPLNQGLKQNNRMLLFAVLFVFTLQSIKSRIETIFLPEQLKELFVFLLYSPLNQGLKLSTWQPICSAIVCFYSTVH